MGFCDIQFMATELTDGVVSLRPPRPEDAADHLAGEDREIAKWLSGGQSTMATVQSYIRSCEENWRGGGPRRAFGIFDCATNRLIGSIEANLAFPLLEPTQANVSYGVFPAWRGNGTALRALRLMGAYLKSVSGMRQMILRISCENTASLRVAEKSGFQHIGIFEEPEGRMVRYALDLR
jgi:RimJ/RimL family protein N-acetyltransferase